MGTPPPANLTIPDLGDEFIGQTVYLAVIQTEIQCPVRPHSSVVPIPHNLRKYCSPTDTQKSAQPLTA